MAEARTTRRYVLRDMLHEVPNAFPDSKEISPEKYQEVIRRIEKIAKTNMNFEHIHQGFIPYTFKGKNYILGDGVIADIGEASNQHTSAKKRVKMMVIYAPDERKLNQLEKTLGLTR